MLELRSLEHPTRFVHKSLLTVQKTMKFAFVLAVAVAAAAILVDARMDKRMMAKMSTKNGCVVNGMSSECNHSSNFIT